MARDWRRRALAALAAAALGSVCALSAHAQAAKKAKAPQPEAEQQSEDAEQAQSKAPAAPAKKKKQDPAVAQRAIEAAVQFLQAGKAEQAAQSLSATLSGGNLPPALMAKALYTRGVANRQLKKPAQAISDLTSALWLKGGLGEVDRADAMQQRAAAYHDAGLGDGGGAVASAAPPVLPSAPSAAAPSAAPAAPRSTGSGWVTPPTEASLAEQRQRAPAPAPAAKSGWNILDPFGLFSAPAPQTTGSIKKSETSTQRPEPAAAQAPAAPTQPQASGWSSNTQVSSAPEARGRGTAAAAAPAKPAGKFRVQLASVRTQQEALSIAAKAKREHADVLAAREAEVDEAVVGNMGAFYRVRIGPFATLQETQTVCAKLKGSGFDCHAVTQ